MAVDAIQFYVSAQWLVLPTVLQLPWKTVLIFPGMGCSRLSYTLHYESKHLLLCLTVNRHRQMLTHLHTQRYKSGFLETAPDITALAAILGPSEKLWRFSSPATFKSHFSWAICQAENYLITEPKKSTYHNSSQKIKDSS